METRSNKILVSFVVALVIAAIIAFALWMTANRRSSGRPYDIVVTKSVSGLAVGSPVTFSGVPVGRVNSVRLDPVRPDAIRIRIDITDDDLAITEGTVAHLKGDLFFGTALLSLSRETRGGRPLLAQGGAEAPIIPLEGGGMGDVVGDPTPMVESIAYATDRLLAATEPEQQRLLAERIQGMERLTAKLAAESPRLGERIAPVRQRMRDTAAASADMAQRARLMRRDLDSRSRAASRDTRASFAAARGASDALNQRLETARPTVQGFSASVAASGERIRQAREGIAAVKEQVQAVESGGAGALLSGPPTPDYKPARSR